MRHRESQGGKCFLLQGPDLFYYNVLNKTHQKLCDRVRDCKKIPENDKQLIQECGGMKYKQFIKFK